MLSSTSSSPASSDSPRSKESSGNSWQRHGTALPSWTDLEHTNARRHTPTSDGPFLEQVSTVRFAIFVVVLAATFTAYVGHVHATQELLADVQQAQAHVHQRARQLGMEETVAYGLPVPMP